MAQAEHEPTSPAPGAKPVSSDAELVTSAYEAVCAMADPLLAIGDYARAIELIASTLDDGHSLAAVLARLAEDIRCRNDALEDARGRLFHALHPRRNELGFPDGGNGEVEEAGDAQNDPRFAVPARRSVLAGRGRASCRRSR